MKCKQIKMSVFTEENSKQTTSFILWKTRKAGWHQCNTEQGSPVHLSWPGNTPRFFVPAPMKGQARLIPQRHPLLSCSLLHCNSSTDTFPRHYCHSKREITQRTRLIFPNSGILALPLLFRMDVLRFHRINPIQRIQQRRELHLYVTFHRKLFIKQR